MITVEIDITDFIDVALTIMIQTEDRDILDYYLSLLKGKNINSKDFERYENMFRDESDFSIIDESAIGDKLNELELVLIEVGQWE